MERDLPALWRSPEWRADIESWLLPALAGAGRTVTGPVVQDRVRFWSTVLHVETDAGRVWVKENAPSQAFEAALVDAVEGIVPGLCAPLVAVDTERGWLATADLGLPLWHDETPPPVDDWVAVTEGYAMAQRTLADHADAVLAAGVPRFPEAPDAVVALGDRPDRASCGHSPQTTRAGRPRRSRRWSTTASSASTTRPRRSRAVGCRPPSSTTTSTSATPSGDPGAG